MGGAVAPDGSMAMQCQSCHGNMSQVGSTNRVGWFMEPVCQSCHSGTATANSGQIRFTSVFTDTNYTVRVPADTTFATSPNVPAPGLSLYRFSVGHGGLQCEACHGSTHAEFPSTDRNDNLRNMALQGHVGVMSECTACHTNSPSTVTGGPHGMHPVGSAWVSSHPNLLGSGQANRAQCQPCHGTDYRGTVLSRMKADRSLSGFGTKALFRGATIGCYTCHQGPGNDSANTNAPPTVANVFTNTTNDKAVALALPATGTGLTLSIISQSTNGTVGLSNGLATYFPSPGFVGTDQFTFAAYDGSKNSNLGTGTVTVAQGPFSLTAAAYPPPSYPANWPVACVVVPTPINTTATAAFDWDFGDGAPHSTNQYAAHAYTIPGTYNWAVISSVAGVTATNTGAITISDSMLLSTKSGDGLVTLSWPNTIADALLESSPILGASAQWQWVTNNPSVTPGTLSLTVPATGNDFFRLRRPW
jgi:PKD repeat protein